MIRPLFIILSAAAALAQPLSQREILKRAIADDPSGPWPRGLGHVILAAPGSRLDQKGYHEPGGSFSPSPGSFGLQIQIHDSTGQLTATSDNIPLDKLTQRWVPGPGIETTTPSYRAIWTVSGPQQFTLKLEPKIPPDHRLFLVIASAGPAGGPIRSLKRRNDLLRVNDRWEIVAVPGAANIQMFGEPEDGWAQAWIESPPKGPWTITVTDHQPQPDSPLPAAYKLPVLDLPDKRFSESLTAQILHLRMGLTGAETRPGEPINYPLPWLRDGSYAVTALAMSGDLESAKILARRFAEHDFFGGFGPEADAPGLALWTLEELSARLRDKDFDRWLWPHAVRKAEYIRRMLETPVAIREIVEGPIVPRHIKNSNIDLVCDPARDGLIIGRMDHHRPLLYVNGVSYRGLLAAASMAKRAGDSTRADDYSALAIKLREAWWRAFDTKERDNERTAVVGLWPSTVAADQPVRYRAALREPQFAKRPLWTYFDIANAHQWLLLGERDRVWKTLEYFWANQPSPGLYSMWEGEGEENAFGLWENIRGWVNPPHITPHYWAASEMLALQLDMLAYADDQGLIIGAGIPDTWAKKPMKVSGISTKLGLVAWTWDTRRLTVTLDGKPAQPRPGPALRSGAR